jgi:hypothetical protein
MHASSKENNNTEQSNACIQQIETKPSEYSNSDRLWVVDNKRLLSKACLYPTEIYGNLKIPTRYSSRNKAYGDYRVRLLKSEYETEG